MKVNFLKILKKNDVDTSDWSEVKESVGYVEDYIISELYKGIKKKYKLEDVDMDLIDIQLDITLEPIGDESKVEVLVDEDGEEFTEDPRPVKVKFEIELNKFKNDHTDEKTSLLDEKVEGKSVCKDPKALAKEIESFAEKIDEKVYSAYKA